MRTGRPAVAAALAALGTAFEPLAALIVAALALALDAVEGSDGPVGAAAPGFLLMTAAIAVVAGGLSDLAPAAPALAPLPALPFALPGLLHRRLRRRGASRGSARVAFAAGWLLAEGLLVHGLDLPALRIGHVVASTPLRRLAAFAGAGAVSVGAIAAACGLLAVVRRGGPSHRPRRALATGLAGLLPLAPGPSSWSPAAAGAGPATEVVRVALVQSDVRASDREAAAAWPDLERTLDRRSLRAAREAASRGATLIVAPETAIRARPAGPLPEVPRPGRAPFAVLAGAVVRNDGGLRNAVVDLAADGRVRHVKAHTVPWFERRFVPGAPATAPVEVAGRRAGLTICYEILFARDVRRVARRSDLLISVSDAAFAGRSALPHLQLGIARLRAAETGRPLLFVTATGPSAVLDARGRILARTARFRPRVLVHDLALRPDRPVPLYARFGVEAEALALLTVLAVLPRGRGVRPLERDPRPV